MMAEFLKDLPCHNRLNFQNIDSCSGASVDSTSTTTSRSKSESSFVQRPPVYIQTKDYPEQQVLITTEKTNILLRYLENQYQKKNKKRDHGPVGPEESPRKQMKLSSN